MLKKESLPISFSKGLDTKTDEWQVSPENFLVLKNQVFTKGGRLTKRNGFGKLSMLPSASSTHLTTLNDNLTAIGNSIYAYNDRSGSWVTKGAIQPMEVDTLSLIRNNLNQTQCDAAVAPNGIVCTVYSQLNNSTTTYYYAIADSITGQNIVSPISIPVTSGVVTGSPRVFVLGNYFIVMFTNVITATSHLQYIAISTMMPTVVTANADIAAAYISSPNLSWDAYTVDTKLFIAYNTTTGGQAIKVTYLSASAAAIGGAPATAKTYALSIATTVSVTADVTNPASPIVWVNYFDIASFTGFALAVDQNLNAVLAPTATILSGTIVNIATAAQNGVCTLFAEQSNFYSYDANIPTNLIRKYTITQAGVVTGPTISIRSVGLASKAFIVDGVIFYLSEYLSQYQPTYFLINGSTSTSASPAAVGKLAYENGNTVAISSSTVGYLPLGLPSVSIIDGNSCYVAYLLKTTIAAVNKDTNVPSGTQTAGIYSQTGINLGTFTIGTQDVGSSEIGNDLLITGGFLWMYDGYLPVEQNFLLFPDNVEPVGVSTAGGLIAQQYYYQATYEWTDNQGNIYRSAPSIPVPFTVSTAPANFTADRTSGSAILINVSSLTGLQVGQPISGTGIPVNTYILSIDSATQITMSANATSGAPTSTTVTPTTLGSLSIRVPTLRLTYKIASPVKIVLYRWSTAQQVYYQVTSLTAPTLNVTTSDSVTITDSLSDAAILGNNIIYTNGGVVENINGPASNLFTLFDTRFWMVDAENDNLWFSKQVIQSVPVEMSDLFTIYVSPTIGSQGSTGKIGAIAPMDDKLIIYKKNPGIYYINGVGPDNTGANNQYSQPIFVTTTVGCENQKSVIMTPNGLMFQASFGKGVWLLDRSLQTKYIGAPVEAFNESTVTSASTIPNSNQVRFTLDTGEILMYDYFYEQWATFVGVPAISGCISEGLHTLLNDQGSVYQETPGTYLDGSNPVLLGLTTAWINLAGLQGYQRAYFFYLLGRYLTPHKLQVSVAYDYNSSPSQSSLISPTNYSQPYGGPNPNPGDGTDSEDPYGQGTPYGGETDVEQWRIFLTKQRCQSFQITIEEIYDQSFGVSAGAGLTLSGINVLYGYKSGFRPIASRHSVGGGTR